MIMCPVIIICVKKIKFVSVLLALVFISVGNCSDLCICMFSEFYFNHVSVIHPIIYDFRHRAWKKHRNRRVQRGYKPRLDPYGALCVACLFVLQIVLAQKLNCTVSYDGMIGLLGIVVRSSCVLTQ